MSQRKEVEVSQVRNEFDPENFRRTRRPALEASGLPAYCYTSPEWYQREIERIFMKEWLLVGRADQIPNVGDYFVVGVAGEPIVVVRDRQHRVRALSASCRHRGTPVVSGEGNCKVFRCPYHRWTYSLEGTLLGAPEMDQTKNFNRSEYGLVPIRLESWDGFLFINLDQGGISLSNFLGELPTKLARYRLSELVCTRRKTYDLRCNWKLAIDNTIENYHLPAVHEKTIEQYAGMNTWRVDEEAHGSYLMVYGEFAGSLALLEGVQGFPPIEGLGEDEKERHDIPFICPNTHILCTVDSVFWLTWFPEGPERTKLVVNSGFPQKTAERSDFEEIAALYYERLDSTLPEDIRIVELQQQGLRARLNRPGRYSYHEKAVHAFANYVVDRVLGAA